MGDRSEVKLEIVTDSPAAARMLPEVVEAVTEYEVPEPSNRFHLVEELPEEPVGEVEDHLFPRLVEVLTNLWKGEAEEDIAEHLEANGIAVTGLAPLEGEFGVRAFQAPVFEHEGVIGVHTPEHGSQFYTATVEGDVVVYARQVREALDQVEDGRLEPVLRELAGIDALDTFEALRRRARSQ